MVLAPEAFATPPRLRAKRVSKRFGSLAVLDGVSLTIQPGTVHALLGENGAGKSTLVKCIMGYYPADSGTIQLDDVDVTIRNPREAQAHGIGMVYQHFTVVPNMTVAENFMLARARVPLVIDWARHHADLRSFMQRMPFSIEPTRKVSSLATGERQKLEILKQLYLGNRILILDEPTSVLTPSEADQVLGMLRDTSHAGRLSVLMITHKLREVTRFADEVTVLRRGRMAGQGTISELSVAEMASMMVGGARPKATADRVEKAPGAVRLEVYGLCALDDDGVGVLNGVSLTVRQGEIAGIAGVSGNGQDELVEVLAGQRRPVTGYVRVDGVHYGCTREEARTRGLRCLPEEPLRNACVAAMTVAENIGLRLYDTPAFTRWRWIVRRGALRRLASKSVGAFRIDTPSVDVPIAALSGGNVQRAVLARELEGNIRVLVVANPCFGLDFAAVAEIRARLLDARNRGVAILLVSADLDEVFALADRVLVMSEGVIVHETSIGRADVAEIGKCMAGHRHS
ncbi:MAG: ABC transporter ATP-binding protein [Myxococcota bacterium]|nr:ABC transporter ATP-binding protein [Myxococcota bacterium]